MSTKARLLWRSDLVLVDGTRLPGVAIVSYGDPFGGEDAAADLCLALEMLRNQPLDIVSKTTDRHTNWVADEVKVCIDPKERVTWSFFQRVFCFEADFVQYAGGGEKERSAQVLLLAPNGPTSEFAIFAQPLPYEDTAASSSSRPIQLVIGRRVAQQPKRTAGFAGKDLSRARSFSRQPSIGSQSLHDVFSQAGLSLPAFGGIPTLGASAIPRPDDPLPRGSISAMLQARSKRKPVHTERNRGISPIASTSQSPLPQSGTHTPGRRGEKRRSNSDRKVPGSPSLAEDEVDKKEEVSFSPTKAIRYRADRILSDLPRLNLGKQPTRTALLPASTSTQLLDVKPKVKVESASPEPFLADTKDEPLDKANRNMIKKVVHTLLVREHNLTKQDADYIATYNQTCSGTWCTFRNIATTRRLAKDAVEDVVRIHLSLYLYSSQS